MTLLEYYIECNKGRWETHGDDVQYRIMRIGDITEVYFQCTVSKRDWLDNFDVLIVPYRGARWLAHRGFVRKYKSIADELMVRLADAQQVYFIGFSQGAALSVLAHEDYVYRYGKKPTTYAFGCPRVMSWASIGVRGRFEGCHIYNHRRDIVGRVPFVCLGYKHVRPVAYLGNSGLWSHLFHYPVEYERELGKGEIPWNL